MENARPFHVAYVIEHPYDGRQVMAVEWSEIAYVETFEYVLLMGDQRLQAVVEAHDRATAVVGDQMHLPKHVVDLETDVVVGLGCCYMGKIRV